MSYFDDFLKDAESKSFDLEHRRKINFNIGKYNTAVQKGLNQYEDHELARERASFIKTHTIENLAHYLVEFETNFKKRGGNVLWASDRKDVITHLLKIFQRKNPQLVVKSKSMTTEEVHLNDFLEDNGIEVIETDLGEYIVQLAGQKPYHIVTPAMHMSKKDVSDLFVKKLHIQPTDDAQVLTLTARKLLRDKYTQADIGITGANFLLADIGAICITENEGNGRLSTTFPKTHIAIVGIEKIIPSWKDLELFWPLLATSGTGQYTTVYNTIFSGPRQAGEKDGPEEMIVILLDNGRTDLLAEVDKRQALNCIRCGACLNTCPVYKNIGGHTYQSTYSGPIGSIITPHYEGMEQFKHLSYASSLCGSCTSVCPVKIDIHNLLLLNRKQSVEEGYGSKMERVGFKIWKWMMKSSWLTNLFGGNIKNKLLSSLFGTIWGKRRSMIKLSPKSFYQLWNKKNKGSS